MLRRAFHTLLFTPLFCFWLPTLAAQPAHGQSLQTQPHPNHYIILVDAAVDSKMAGERRRVYETTLLDSLASKLYGEGFGQHIPAYDPRQDYLTLYHFGVVTGGGVDAYRRLAEHDLREDFIHPIFTRESGAGVERLRAGLFPEQRYQYTILTWCKQLALHYSRPGSADRPNQRTFVVAIHDGRPNEHTVRGEMEMVRQWSGARYAEYDRLVKSIDHNYRFTDGAGNEGAPWSEEVKYALSGEEQLFFMEAYEVVSAARADWEARAERLHPLDDLSLRWTQQSGDSLRGVLRAAPGKEFAEWLQAADAAEVTLGAGGGESGATRVPVPAPSALEVPVAFRGAPTCDPQTLEVTLRAGLRRADPLLGSRAVRYEQRRAVEAPPSPSCARRSALLTALPALAALLALAAAGYYVYSRRRRATHLDLLIPGTRAPVRLERGGRREGYAAVVPQEGLEALALRLPGRLGQRIFYKGATVTLTAEGGGAPLGWFEAGGPAELRLPLEQTLVPAYWGRMPAGPSAVTVTFRQKKKSADLVLTYPRALADSDTRSPLMHDNSVYVALDLGSESMAAYYEDRRGHYGMIKMQSLAKKLRAGSEDWEPELLPGDGGKNSPRLWNRISLKDKAQPAELKEDHGALQFILPPNGDPKNQEVSLDAYRLSLFNFFHRSGGWPVYQHVMPNPKILFQQQVTDIMTPPVVRVEADGGGLVRLEPETLIKHLTLQVINNFVLNSAELSRFDRRDINLTITVPNVYSLPHAENIREFVRQNVTELASVEVLSESDAVTFYALKGSDKKRDSPEMLRFKGAWKKELKRSGAACFVTIDVGKGTTDLSCILVQEPPSRGVFSRLKGRGGEGEDARQRRHSVQGKTGKTTGGTYLNYLFARYYDERLAEVIAATPEETFNPAPCGLLTRATDERLLGAQARAAAALEDLIEQVKRSMTDDYDIDEGKLSTTVQRELVAKVVDEILTGVNPAWARPEDRAALGDRAAYEGFREAAMSALLLPSKLVPAEPPSRLSRAMARLKDPFSRKRAEAVAGGAPYAASVTGGATETAAATPSAAAPLPSARTAELKRSLERYVRENVDDLLESLKLLVEDHQTFSDDTKGIDSTTFVILSGQGSLFKPLRAAVIRKCGEMGIDREQMLLLKGSESKDACCKGVVNFWLDRMQTINRHELHGTYGCMDFVTDEFKPFDMREVNTRGESTIDCGTEALYHIVYTPRSSRELEEDEQQPQLNDGATAVLGSLVGKTKFKLRYDHERLRLTVNDRPVSISGFGQADSSIYEKVWPEILEPSTD